MESGCSRYAGLQKPGDVGAFKVISDKREYEFDYLGWYDSRNGIARPKRMFANLANMRAALPGIRQQAFIKILILLHHLANLKMRRHSRACAFA